jgi:hypothetical protein
VADFYGEKMHSPFAEFGGSDYSGLKTLLFIFRLYGAEGRFFQETLPK